MLFLKKPIRVNVRTYKKVFTTISVLGLGALAFYTLTKGPEESQLRGPAMVEVSIPLEKMALDPELHNAVKLITKVAKKAPAFPKNSEKMARFLDSLGSDATALHVRQGLQDFLGNLASEGKFAKFENTSLVKGWIADPARGVAEVRTILERISVSQYPEFRTELIRILGLIPSESLKSEVHAIAAAEVQNNIVHGFYEELQAKKIDPLMPLVTTAFSVALKHGPTDGAALAFAVESIENQPDPLVRYSMMTSYLVRYPKNDKKLLAALSHKNIENPERTMATLTPLKNTPMNPDVSP